MKSAEGCSTSQRYTTHGNRLSTQRHGANLTGSTAPTPAPQGNRILGGLRRPSGQAASEATGRSFRRAESADGVDRPTRRCAPALSTSPRMRLPWSLMASHPCHSSSGAGRLAPARTARMVAVRPFVAEGTDGADGCGETTLSRKAPTTRKDAAKQGRGWVVEWSGVVGATGRMRANGILDSESMRRLVGRWPAAVLWCLNMPPSISPALPRLSAPSAPSAPKWPPASIRAIRAFRAKTASPQPSAPSVPSAPRRPLRAHPCHPCHPCRPRLPRPVASPSLHRSFRGGPWRC